MRGGNNNTSSSSSKDRNGMFKSAKKLQFGASEEDFQVNVFTPSDIHTKFGMGFDPVDEEMTEED